MTIKDLEWLKGKITEYSGTAQGYLESEQVVDTDTLFDCINQIDSDVCNWTPSSKKQEPTMWRDYSYPSPEPENAPSLNPKAILHSNITAELNAIYIAKNSDYGDAFGETYKKLGIISAVTRITDKVNRLQSLATKSESERLVKDESIVDSAKDLANYAVMLLIEMGYEPLKKNEIMIGNTKATLYAADPVDSKPLEFDGVATHTTEYDIKTGKTTHYVSDETGSYEVDSFATGGLTSDELEKELSTMGKHIRSTME